MTAGLLGGTFPAGLTTGYQNIGAAQLFRNANGYLGAFPAGLTTGYMNIGAVEKPQPNQYVNSFSDSVTAADNISGLMEATGAINDSVTGSDSQSASMQGNTTISDAVTSADTQDASLQAVTTFDDSVTGADTMGAAMSTAATFSDSVTGSDTMIGGIGYNNTISDAVTGTDSISAKSGFAFTINDSVEAADSIVGGIGYSDAISDSVTAADSFTATVSPSPNIILSGTIDFVYPYRIPNQALTYLDFGVILEDDNFIRVNATNLITGQPLQLVEANIYFYAPNTNTNPVITKSGICALGYFQFELTAEDTQPFTPALYPWLAIITLTDGSHHILNLGDTNLTTGVMTLVNRPY